MKILWFTWKDLNHPSAGGAEVVNDELARRLVQDGHDVLFVVGGFDGSKPEETINGYRVVRVGNRFTVYWNAYRYYRRHVQGWADVVIDEVNTIPFFAKWYVHERSIFFIHQLAREIWFYEMPFPFNLIGYLLEPLYLRLLSSNVLTFTHSYPSLVITVSESTKNDLMKFGFKPENIHIISEGITLEPLQSLSNPYEGGDEGGVKYPQLTILALGAVRSMKRTHHILKAFEILKSNKFQVSSFKFQDVRLIIAGDSSGAYGKRILAMVGRSAFKNDIQLLGRITTEQKIELMRSSHILAVTSVKEGWGLVVTEAASQGAPAVVYNVDGLRDSVSHNETGVICEQNSPEYLAKTILELLSDTGKYERLRTAAWQWSKEINFNNSYQDFKRAINI